MMDFFYVLQKHLQCLLLNAAQFFFESFIE